MSYVDGYVIPVPLVNKEKYRQLAEIAAVIFKENGALQVVESWGNDVPEGKVTSFPLAVQRKDDEVVVFSWIRWSSKQARDEGMAKAMADPRFQEHGNEMPFDGQRMIFGGFDILIDA